MAALKREAPSIQWHALMENVACMSPVARETISTKLCQAYETTPYWLDADAVGPIKRPRLYWPSWKMASGELRCHDTGQGYIRVQNSSRDRVSADRFLDPGVAKSGPGPFPTSVRWYSGAYPPRDPAGYHDCDQVTLDKRAAAGYSMPPYHFKRELGVVTSSGEERPPNANERERLHGFREGHTRGFSESARISFFWGILFTASR